MFGSCGNSAESTNFVVSFKNAINGKSLEDIDALWSQFIEFFDNQTFDSNHSGFCRRLRARHPSIGLKLYELDSAKRTIRPLYSPTVHTLGSGIDVLDTVVRGEAPRLIGLGDTLASQLERMYDVAQKQFGNLPLRVFGLTEHNDELIRCCVLSYMLNSKSLCHQVSELEGAGVGGVFHFIFQTRSIERPQPAIFYIFPTVRARSPEETKSF